MTTMDEIINWMKLHYMIFSVTYYLGIHNAISSFIIDVIFYQVNVTFVQTINFIFVGQI